MELDYRAATPIDPIRPFPKTLLGLIEKAADLKLRVDEQGCPFPSILNLNTLGHWFPLLEL
jgi:hypothetical protein